MEKKFLSKVTMVTLIVVFAILNILMFAIQNVHAEETIDADPILEGALEKYINFDMSDGDTGTLVQYHLRTGMHYKEGSEVFPVKENETTIQVRDIDGKYPYDVKVIMNSTETTNGNRDKDNVDVLYNPEIGVVTINMHNQDENGNMISDKIPTSDSRDDYVLICYYDTYVDNSPEREISLNISSKMTLFTDETKEVYAQGELKNDVTENIGELTSISHETEDIYNGYIKSNIINGTEYHTQYTDTTEINVSKKEAHQKMQITEDNTFVRTNGEEIVGDLGNDNELVYRSTRLEKQNIVELLGEEFSIEVSDENGNVLATIDNNTEFAEDGSFTITYENDVKSLNIKTSNIVSEGILYIENTKEIKNTMRDIENVQVKTTTNIIGINEEEVVAQTEEATEENIEENTEETQIIETESYRNADEKFVEIQSAQTKVAMTVSSTEWTNKQQNDITFDISLDANSIENNLFKDSTLKIQLPSQVEKVILGNYSIVYGNGLTLQDPYTETDENGNISIIANLAGAQTQYDESNLGLMTNVKISATIILKKDIENTADTLNLVYTNNYTLDGSTEEGNIETALIIRSYAEEQNPVEEMIQNVNLSEPSTQQEVLDSLQLEVTPSKGDVTLNNGDIVYEGEYIKFNIKVTNISDTAIQDVKVVGTIPDGVTYGELYAEYYQAFGDYQYNFDESVKEKTIKIGEIKAGETFNTFYEVRVNNLNDQETEKQMTTTIHVLSGDNIGSTYETTNVIREAEAQVYVSSNLANTKNVWNYHVLISGNQPVTLTLKVPEAYELTYIVDGETQQKIDLSQVTVSGNTITFITEPKSYTFGGRIDTTKLAQENDKNNIELTAVATVFVNNVEYKSNENRIQILYDDISISMTSPNEGEEVRYNEEINYDIVLENTGGTNMDNTYGEIYETEINLRDFLPDEVDPVTVTYEDWERDVQIVDEESGQAEIGEAKKVQKTLDISGRQTNENGEKLPNVDLTLHIPYGESIHVQINTLAKYVYEETQINNSAIVSGETIKTKNSNTITHTILPYNVDEGGSTDPSEPTDPNEPTDPSDPTNPTDPDNPQNPDVETYSISGVAWEDENENGQKDSNEPILPGVSVLLVNMADAHQVKSRVNTNETGEYTFTGLEQGNYVVIFLYDTNTYKVTEYQKANVSSSSNSDANAQYITLNGEQVYAGVTDILAINRNTTNIDIGLIENKVYDLKLDKYISKVTVQTAKNTKEYIYDHVNFAKVEIRSKEIEGANVTVEYKVIVTNEGERTANVNSVKDYLPDGFTLVSDRNSNWIENGNGEIINQSMTNQQINPNETIELTVVVEKTMSEDTTGIFVNKAEIMETNMPNGDIDSTPGNGVETEDDFAQAELIISISTGAIIYISIAIIALLIFVGLYFAIRFKLIKINKLSAFIILFTTTLLFMNDNVLAYISPATFTFNSSMRDYISGYDSDGNPIYPYRSYWYSGGRWHYDSNYFNSNTSGVSDALCIEPGATTAPANSSYSYYAYNVDNAYFDTPVITEDDINFTLTNNADDQIGIRTVGDNYILGPFKINATNYTGGYTFALYDKDGNKINNIATSDSTGWEVNITGSTPFYIKVAKSDCTNGISRLTATGTKTGKKRTTKNRYSNVIYQHNTATQQIQTINQYFIATITSEKDISKSDDVEWTNFTGALEIVKTDADDENRILSGVQIRVQNETVGYDETFTTDENGKIYIENLYTGTYKITEISNNHYGYADVEEGETTLLSGTIVEYVLENTKQTGNLRIEKKDADNSNIKLQGVSFRIRKNISVEDEEALADFVEGRGDVNGNGYLEEDDIQDILRYVSEKIDLTDEQLEQADVNGDGEVNIVDMRLLLRKIQSTGYVVGMELNTAGELTPITTATGTVYFDSMTTTNNPQEATIFVTDENGLIQIYNMLTGSYIIEEISVGDNFGYDVDPNFISWEITNSDGTVDTVDLSTSAIVEVTRQSSTETSNTESQNANIVVDKNRRKFIKINGYAWEEKTDGKNSTKDSIYNDGSTDRRLEHVTVRLKDADGNIIRDGNKIAETTTNANGEYVFGNYDEDANAMKLEIDDLVGAYIEFEYNGMSYQAIAVNSSFSDYTETTSNGNTVMKYTSNTNKATDEALRDAFNNNYATISQGISSDTNGNKTYDIRYNYDSTNHKSTVIYGDNVLYGYEGQTYPIAGVYPQYTIQAVTAQSTTNVLCTGVTAEKIRQDAVVEIGGLNLGVEERSMPDLAIVQDMEHVQISLNEYTHTYQYARRFDDPSEYAGGDPFDTTVRFANKYIESSYSREVYSSDVSYNSQNAESMQVYITYIVALRNESADVVSNIKTLSNYYDERYDAIYVRDDSFVRNDDGMMIEYGEDISSEPDESYHKNGMKKENIFANYVIEPSQTRYLTITYELSNEAINSLLNLNDITLDSVTEITSYSTYTDGTRPYAGIDIDSAPDTVNIEVQDNKVSIQNTMEDDTDKAPTLEIIPTEGRILKGTVWEDNAIQSLLEQSGYDKERKGNGIYDNDENVVNKVTVDLMTGTDANNLQPAYLYKEDGTRVTATTETNEQGNYTLSGVIPNADYLLRFTYNNNSVIYDPAGNIIENVDVDNYKSTIYRGGIKEDQGLDWYKEETSKFEDAKRWSDAKDTVGEMEDGTVIPDIVQTRTTQDTEINYGTVTEDKQLSSISANTANFEIELEYDINDINFDHISAYNNQLVWVFDNMDFGIIERPKQSLEVDKQVANLKITLANGTTLMNGDPRTQNLSGVRVLDNHDIYIEIDNEIIQGSTLTVTYEISVDNTNCEIDYNDEDYYIYGIRPADYQNVYKIARVVDMYDYLPSELLFQESTNTNWEKIAIQDTDKGTILSDEVYEAVKGLQNIVHLKTAVFKDMLPDTKAVDTTLVVSRQLSTSSDDLTYENDIEVIKLEDRPTYNSTPGNYDPTTNTPDELDDGNVPVTITAPTGGNRQYFLYGALGISLLIIVGVGIVFIKKKVL